MNTTDSLVTVGGGISKNVTSEIIGKLVNRINVFRKSNYVQCSRTPTKHYAWEQLSIYVLLV